MPRTPEGKVKDAVTRLLRDMGVYYFFPATHGFGRSGVPDIVACVRGRFIGIECKAAKNKPTALQEREMQAIREAGGIALVVSSVDVTELSSVLQIILESYDG